MTHTLKALSKAILLATCSLSVSVAVAESNKPEQLYPPITSEVLPEPRYTRSKRSSFKSRGVVSGCKYSKSATY